MDQAQHCQAVSADVYLPIGLAFWQSVHQSTLTYPIVIAGESIYLFR
jgi:hypothetical protein